MNDRMDRLESRMHDLDVKMTRVDVRTGNAEGRAYETHAARNMPYLLYSQLGIRRATPVYRYQADDPDSLAEMNNTPPPPPQLTVGELAELTDADMVFRGHADAGEDTDLYVIIEASITGDLDDVTRADRRRELMRKLTEAPCLAAIVCETLRETVARGLRREKAADGRPERDIVAPDRFNPRALDPRERRPVEQEIDTLFRPEIQEVPRRDTIDQDVHVLYLATRNSG